MYFGQKYFNKTLKLKTMLKTVCNFVLKLLEKENKMQFAILIRGTKKL